MIKWKRKEKYKGQYNQELEEEELDAIDPSTSASRHS